MRLEDTVHDVGTHSSTGTEDCYSQLACMIRANARGEGHVKHTGIAQLLSELFTAFFELVLLRILRVRGVGGLSTLANLEGHVPVVCRRGRLVRSSLLRLDSHVA